MQRQTALEHAGARACLSDAFAWRMLGASTWTVTVLLLAQAATACVLLLLAGNGSGWCLLGLRGCGLLLAQTGVLLAQWRCTSAAEAAPFHAPKLGLPSRSLISRVLSRVLLRGRRAGDVLAVAALYVTTCTCAFAYAYAHPSLANDATGLWWSTVYGCTTGIFYSTQHLARCRDVLIYPVLQRHRYFRIKAEMPGVVTRGHACAASAAALSMCILHVFPGIWQLLSTYLSVAVCVSGWLCSHAVLNIVYSERLRLLTKTDASFSALLSGGLSSTDVLVQDLVLMELAFVSEEHSPQAAAARQTALLLDEAGRIGWPAIGGFLMTELRDLTGILAAALPAKADARPGMARTGGGGGGRDGDGVRSSMQWNAPSAAARASPSPGSHERDLAAWYIRARGPRAAWCLRTLAALLDASRMEDRYGVLLLSQPNLGDVLCMLASVALVLQQYVRALAAAGGMRGARGGAAAVSLTRLLDMAFLPAHPSLRAPLASAAALEDVARRCTCGAALAFRGSVGAALSEAQALPAFGTAAEVSSLLHALVEGTE